MLVVNAETSVFLPIHFEPKAVRQNHSIFADQPSRNTNGSFIKYDALQPADLVMFLCIILQLESFYSE